MSKKQKKSKKTSVNERMDACRKALNALQGKWKIPILISLTYGEKRFGEIQKDVLDISPKMLSQELKELENSQLLRRTVVNSVPVAISYSLTKSGKSTNKIVSELISWGEEYLE